MNKTLTMPPITDMLKESKERRIFYVYQNGNLGREGLNRFSLDRLGLPILLEDDMPRGFRKDGSKLGFQKGNHPCNEFKKGNKCAVGHGRCKGYKCSEKIIENMKIAFKGRTPWNKGKKCPQLSGENHYEWKGDNAGYVALHIRVYKQRGRPKLCEICGTTDRQKQYDWANLTGKYVDVMDYKRMCKKCHIEYDRKRR